MNNFFWERVDLRYENTSLFFASRNVEEIAKSVGTPLFLYSASRIEKNIMRVYEALEKTSLKHRIFYAMKANRFLPILTFMKSRSLCGIDVCSPEEMLFAMSAGFEANEISYTATSVSDEDLDIIAKQKGLIINCDSISSMRRLAKRTGGIEIGVRVNPALGVGYGESEILRYSGDKSTKFGIYKEQFDDFLSEAKALGMKVVRIHFHTGCGYLNKQLGVWEQILKECRYFVDKVETIREVNLGGGLGVPHVETDERLNYDKWAQIIKENFLDTKVQISVEPGDHIVKDAGMLILKVNTVEKKRDTLFVGVNGGFNLAIEPTFYKLPALPLPTSLRENKDDAYQNGKVVTIAGNINEALDVWYENIKIPAVEEGDYISFINTGGYASAMSSNHCMRGAFRERLLFDY